MKQILLATLALLPLCAFAQQWGLTGYPVGTATTLYTGQRNAYAVDNNGAVWIGFNLAGLGKCDNGTWTFYDQTNSSIPSNKVLAVCPSGNDVWAGTDAGAALLSNNAWTIYTHSNSGLLSDTIYSIYHFGNETWFGTRKGVARFDGTNWITYTRSNSGLLSDSVYCFCLDGSGKLMMGTAKGLSALDLSSSWSSFNDNQNQPFNLNVSALLFESTKGETWISIRNGGVYRMLSNVVYPFNAFTDDFAFTSPASVANFISPSPGVVKFCYWTGFSVGGILTFSGNSNVPHNLHIGGANMFILYSAANGTYYLGTRVGNMIGNSFLTKFDPSQVPPFADGNSPDYENVRPLDVNQVRATIANRGDMHGNSNTGAHYEVPKGGGAGTIFISDLWMGGLDAGNNMHMAAMLFRQNGMDFFPGPLDTITGTTDSTTAEKFDYTWKIDKTKILEFQYYFANGSVQNGSYIPDHDILTWPAHGTGNYSHNLAPFVDVNGNGIYDPLTGGDYPQIRGDQMLYAIFNDNLASHTETGGMPLGVEVHLSAYAYNCPTATNGDTVVNYTTYYHYDVFNRSATTYHNMKLGMFEDNDIGFYHDDFVGCAPSSNLAFAYNGTGIDGGSTTPPPGAYGAQPPISGLLVLDGPDADPNDGIDNDNDGTTDEAGEHNRMTGFVYYNNDFTATGNPQNADDYYGYLNSAWTDGTPITYGGNGYGGVTPTRFMYDGQPFNSSAWNEISAGNNPSDRRFVVSCGPFTFQPQSSTHFDFAIIYSRDMVNPWGTSAYFNTMITDAQRVENWYQASTTPSCTQWNVGMPDSQTAVNTLVLYPNPASSQLTLAYLPQNDHAQFALFDLTGRVVSSGTLSAQGATSLAIDALPDGVYFVRVNDGTHFITKKFVKQ